MVWGLFWLGGFLVYLGWVSFGWFGRGGGAPSATIFMDSGFRPFGTAPE